MAGGVLKGFGITFLTFGTLLLAVGLAAVGYGATLVREHEDDGLLADPNDRRDGEDLLLAGGVAFAVGLVLLLLGLVLNGAGNRRRHQELAARVAGRQAPAAQTTAAAPGALPRTARKQWVVGGFAIGIGLAILLATLGVAGGGGRGGASAGGLFRSSDSGFAPLAFDGVLRQAVAAPLAGAFTADSTGSQQAFDAPAGASSLDVTLTWTPAEGGAEELRILLEADGPGGWTEIARHAGQGPLAFAVPLDGDGSSLRYRVFLHGSAAAALEQPFHVDLAFHR